ncbi:MAG: hypothetical protein AB1585_10685 [Thermodesulfobacteriota bacterium]
MIIFDCEILRAVPGRDGVREPGIEYCGGWRDFAGMGLACIGVYDYAEDIYRVFLRDNYSDFQKLVDSSDWICGFNNIQFDYPLCAANGIVVSEEKSYDLLREIWAGAGFGPEFDSRTHAGFGLEACCLANFNLGKSGNGALAPVQWQRGEYGAVIDYCLRDVWLTKKLLDQVLDVRKIWDPRDPEREILVKRPI